MKLTLKHAVAAILLVLSFAAPVAAAPITNTGAPQAYADAPSKRGFKPSSKFWIVPPGEAWMALWHWNEQQKRERELKPDTPPAR